MSTHRTARSTGHSLLLLAIPAILIVLIPSTVLVATDRSPSTDTLASLVLVASLPLATPAALGLLYRRWDPYVLAPAWVLCALGLGVIARVQPDLVTTQLLWIAAGWAAFVSLVGFPPLLPWLLRFRYWLLGAGIALIGVTLVMGEDVTGEGARLWLRFGPVGIQPAEVVRVLLVSFIAGHLALRTPDPAPQSTAVENRASMRSLTGDWAPLAAMFGLTVLAVLAQRDFGPSLVFGSTLVGLLYLATGRKRYVLIATAVAVLGALLVYGASARIEERVDVWLDPWADPRGSGYQSLQALGGFVFGGVFGAGPGYGYPGLIPAAHTDYPLAVIGEEWGLVGSIVVIALYGLLIVHTLARSRVAASNFAQLLLAGLAISLAAQVLLVFGGVVRLLPLTGLTSPFLSYGGSSMVMGWVMLALIVSASSPDRAEERALRRTPPALALPRVRHVGVAVLAGFTVLSLTLGYWQVGRADLITDPAVAGERHRVEETRIQRGDILDRNGEPLAQTELGPDGQPHRVYLDPGAVHLLGYVSALGGAAGVESAAADRLLGRDSPSPRDTWLDLLNESRSGDEVRLTIDVRIQRVAEQALEGATGAVVALDPHTGEILAMASTPTFDPNFSTEEWELLRTAEGSPLLNRATLGLYTPGSTFKTVTLAAALETGLVTPETPAECPAEVFIDGVRIVSNNEPPGRTTQTVADAYAYSCNTFFAQLGLEVGEERLREMAEALGLSDEVPFTLPTSRGRLSSSEGFLGTDAGLAATAFGQGELQLSPLHLALLAGVAVNDGVVQRPTLLLGEQPEAWRRALSPGAAADLEEMMRYSVEAGWASTVAIPGLEVGGKTGSAEVIVEENPHALFIAWAEQDGRAIAVAVIKEFAGSGSQQAGPAARAVIDAWAATRD
ncbi:MAG: FtsW/RodA/SpoVE family cell cycle protein [Dehalococcoidia bacterium]